MTLALLATPLLPSIHVKKRSAMKFAFCADLGYNGINSGKDAKRKSGTCHLVKLNRTQFLDVGLI